MAYYCSVTKSCPTLCDPMKLQNFPILHYLPEFTQTHVHPTISSSVAPSPFALNLSQHQGLSNESALLIRWPKYWSFSFSINLLPIQGWFPLGLTGLISLLSRGLSRVFSRTTQMALKTSPRLTQLLSSWVSLCILVSLTQQTHPAPLSLEKAFLSAR